MLKPAATCEFIEGGKKPLLWIAVPCIIGRLIPAGYVSICWAWRPWKAAGSKVSDHRGAEVQYWHVIVTWVEWWYLGEMSLVFSASYSCFLPHVQASLLPLEGERAWPQMNCFTTSCLWCTSAAIKQYAKTHIYLYLGLSHSEIWLTESGLLHNRRSVVLGTAWLSPWPRPKTEPCFSDIWSRLLFHYALNVCATVLCYWIRAESVKCELKCHASGHFMFPELRLKSATWVAQIYNLHRPKRVRTLEKCGRSGQAIWLANLSVPSLFTARPPSCYDAQLSVLEVHRLFITNSIRNWVDCGQRQIVHQPPPRPLSRLPQ